jgi:ABC-type molybdate transport system permease subunit
VEAFLVFQLPTSSQMITQDRKRIDTELEHKAELEAARMIEVKLGLTWPAADRPQIPATELGERSARKPT